MDFSNRVFFFLLANSAIGFYKGTRKIFSREKEYKKKFVFATFVAYERMVYILNFFFFFIS